MINKKTNIEIFESKNIVKSFKQNCTQLYKTLKLLIIFTS
jgi:hypothetical protein